jgi:NitT/TauT family transport system substrate-binding protein
MGASEQPTAGWRRGGDRRSAPCCGTGQSSGLDKVGVVGSLVRASWDIVRLGRARYALIMGAVLSLTGPGCAPPTAQVVAVDKPPASAAKSGADPLSPGGAVSVVPAGSAPLQRVTVGVTRSSPDAPLFLADEHGYFKDAGLAVSLEEFQSGAALIPPLSTGQIDAGGGGLSVGLYNAIARGVALRAVADRARENGIGVLVVRQALAESGRVRGASDIRGLRLVLPADCIASEVTLQRYLERYGITMQEVDLRVLSLTDLPAAIANGSADLGTVPEPVATLMEQSGSGVILHRLGSDLEPYRQLSVILYSPTFAEDRDRATGFMVAYLRGVRDYYDAFFGSGARRDEMIRLLVEKTTNKRPDLYDQKTMPLIDPNGEINVQSMVEDQDYYLARGCQPQPIDVAQSVDRSFAQAAVARLGRY